MSGVYLVSLQHPSKWFEVLKYDKDTHKGVVRGCYAEFEEVLTKYRLDELGYKIVRGDPRNVTEIRSPTKYWMVAEDDERIRMPILRVVREEGKIVKLVAQGAFMELEYTPSDIRLMKYRVVKET